MTFRRELLPAPLDYYASRLHLIGKGKWRTAGCPFHGSHDSLRVNTETGSFVCMAACGARGGDTLSFEMAVTGDGFIECAKRLGAWIDDKPGQRRRPTQFTASDALEVAAAELNFAAVALTNFNFAKGIVPTDADTQRMRLAAARLSTIRDWVNL